MTPRGGLWVRELIFMRVKHAFAAVLAAALIFSGCGEKRATPDFEKRLQAAAFAANYRDEDSYISCWLPQEKERFLASDEYEEGFLGKPFELADSTGRLVFKVISSKELSDEQVEVLESSAKETYGTRFDFTKARTADVELRLNSRSEVLTDARDITLVRYESNWYIYGKVISSFSFAGS